LQQSEDFIGLTGGSACPTLVRPCGTDASVCHPGAQTSLGAPAPRFTLPPDMAPHNQRRPPLRRPQAGNRTRTTSPRRQFIVAAFRGGPNPRQTGLAAMLFTSGLECRQPQLPARRYRKRIRGGPVFLDWRRGRFAGAGWPGSFYGDSQGFVTGFRRLGYGRDRVGADQDDILVAGFEAFQLFQRGVEGAAVELMRCWSRVKVWSPCWTA